MSSPSVQYTYNSLTSVVVLNKSRNVWFSVCTRTEPAFFSLNHHHHEAFHCAIQRHAWRYVAHTPPFMFSSLHRQSLRMSPISSLHTTHISPQNPWWGDSSVLRQKGTIQYSTTPPSFSIDPLTTPSTSTITLSVESRPPYAPQLPLQRIPPSLWRSPLFPHPFQYRYASPFLVPFVYSQSTGYGIYAWAKNYEAFHNSKAGHIAAGAH
jgi:hypothetical protein